MKSSILISIVVFCSFAAWPVAYARVGETEAQSAARYGAEVPGLVGEKEQALLIGARELAYNHEGWRIRVAFLNGKAARLEYAKIPDAAGLKKLTEPEITAILASEKGTYRWREEKPKTGYAALNALQTAFEGRRWERSDHAIARLKADLVLTVDAREVEAHEKKQARISKPGATPAVNVPKF